MIKNLSDYFLPEQEFYLHKINYDRITSGESGIRKSEISLNCTDNIVAEVNDLDEVKIIVTRSLYFDPEDVFCLSVAFGAELKINPNKKNDYNWHELNLAEEFRDNGDFVVSNLMNRISLLIAQITSSFGQQPLMLPPTIIKSTE